MPENSSSWLSLMTFVPLLGALMILLVPSREKKVIKAIAGCATLLPLVISLWLLHLFQTNVPGVANVGDFGKIFQFVERYTWIKGFNIQYYMGVDGISFPLVLLTTLLSFLCVIGSLSIKKSVKGYFALFLLLETGIIGTFCALDLFLFFVFWEVMLLPMYFLIGIWGGPRKEYAAIKFFLYTFFGSVFLLLGMLAVYFACDKTFAIPELAARFRLTGDASLRYWVFVGFFVAFGIKVPIFPFHTWLPDAHVEAPTAISVILAGVLLKLGTYGIMRIAYPLCPDAALQCAWWIAILSFINIIYGAMCAMAQKDLKKLVAYSSVSHMGIVTLGLVAFNDAGFTGGTMQMFNHGCVTAMMFFLVGVIYDRAHHREIDGFGGLASVVPVYTGIATLAFFAALGLPGTSSFISEALSFLGGFAPLSGNGPHGAVVNAAGTVLFDPRYVKLATCLSIPGILVTAAYVLWTLQRVCLGPINPKYKNFEEITPREIFSVAPLAVIVLAIGIYPAPLLDLMNQSLTFLKDIVIH